MDRHSRPDRIARNGFREITASLLEKIRVGDFTQGAYLPTERELQIDFGASRTTVRKALAALVESGWALNVPNRGVKATRGLRPGLSKNVAFINNGSYVARILSVQLAELLEKQGLDMVPMGGRSDYSMEYGLQRAVDNNFVGAIVWPNIGFPDVEFVAKAARQLPIVAIDHPIPGIETDLVTFDHEQAAYLATEHLAKQGAKRIGISGMLDMLDISHDRFRGYLRALFANGLKPDAKDFLFTLTSGHDEADTSVLEMVLALESRPDAFFVMNDICLPSVVEAAAKVGLRVPEELKLAGIGDDLDLVVAKNRMTAVAFDWSALASHATDMLVARLDNLHAAPRRIVAPHQLKVRGLCGADPSTWTDESHSTKDVTIGNQTSRVHYVFNSRKGADEAPKQSRSREILI